MDLSKMERLNLLLEANELPTFKDSSSSNAPTNEAKRQTSSPCETQESKQMPPAPAAPEVASEFPDEDDFITTKQAKKAAVKATQRAARQHSEKLELAQAERFLGLRGPHIKEVPVQEPTWAAVEAYHAREEQRAELNNPPPISISSPPPHELASSGVVLIAIDVEAWERDHRAITEIGVTTLDTRDLTNVPPGEHGRNWYSLMAHRHFRISEQRHLANGDFVGGAAGNFRFGVSEFVGEADAAAALVSCFPVKNGASKKDESHATTEDRTVVIVGHDFTSDVKLLAHIGIVVNQLPNLHPRYPIIDTQRTYRAYKHAQLKHQAALDRAAENKNKQQEEGAAKDTETDSRSFSDRKKALERDREKQKSNVEVNGSTGLAGVAREFGIVPFALHNAGNDAAYTMQALLGIAVGSAGMRRGGG